MERKNLFKSKIVNDLQTKYTELRNAGIKDIKLSYKDSKGNVVRVNTPQSTSDF